MKQTGDVAKVTEEMLAPFTMVSTACLAGWYSAGGGREDDIPYSNFCCVARIAGAWSGQCRCSAGSNTKVSTTKCSTVGETGSPQTSGPSNLKLNCCLAWERSKRKFERWVWNWWLVERAVQLVFCRVSRYCLNPGHQLSTSAQESYSIHITVLGGENCVGHL